MTELQFERWRDFAMRMARTCYRTSRKPTGKWIVEVVEDFFGRFDDPADYVCIVDWAHSGVSEFVDEYCNIGGIECRACRDGNGDDCQCDESTFAAQEQWDEQYGGPVCCCIRAGFDCAVKQSAGVIGFTAGDIRAMYPEGVPEWVFPPGEKLHYWLSGEVNGTFADLADSAGVGL